MGIVVIKVFMSKSRMIPIAIICSNTTVKMSVAASRTLFRVKPVSTVAVGIPRVLSSRAPGNQCSVQCSPVAIVSMAAPVSFRHIPTYTMHIYKHNGITSGASLSASRPLARHQSLASKELSGLDFLKSPIADSLPT